MPEAPGPQSSQPAPATAEEKGELVNGRYRVLRRLGQGGMGTVYLVQDIRQQERTLALKRVRRDRLDGRTLAILRNEFLSLAPLTHPSLARVYDFGVDFETRDLFFTSDFVDGADWREATKKLDLSSKTQLNLFLDLTTQVLRGLEYIHCHGLVHGDIKPGNILITGKRKEGSPLSWDRVKMIDFGLTRKEKEFTGKKILGTPYYVAPETILGSQVDRRTDLYSLGVVLYHLTAGKPPFRGKSNLDIIKAHVERKPMPPTEVSPHLSQELSLIILRLMEKDPENRFQSALEVIDEINRSLGTSFPLETSETLLSYLREARLAGREEELAHIRTAVPFLTVTDGENRPYRGEAPVATEARRDSGALPGGRWGGAGPSSTDVSASTSWGNSNLEVERWYRPSRTGPPEESDIGRVDPHAGGAGLPPLGRSSQATPLLLLRGDKGLGKRWLIDELRCLVQVQEATFLTVECGDGSGGLDSLLEELESLPLSPGAGNNLAQLRRLATEVDQGSEEENLGPRQTLAELALLTLKSTQRCPVLLHLHDIHQARLVVAEFVSQLVAALAADRVADSRLFITATAQDDVQAENDGFRSLVDSPLFREQVLELRLQRLDQTKVARLVSKVFSGCKLPKGFVDRIHEESDGIPEVILEILRFLLQRQTIQRIPNGWFLEENYESVALPGQVRSQLRERIAALSEESLRLAVAFAILGDPFESELAGRLVELPQRDVERNLKILRRQRLLQEDYIPGRGRVQTLTSTSVRQILYQALPLAERRRLHNRAGSLLEEHFQSRHEKHSRQVVHHYLEARNQKKGVEHGVEVARALGLEGSAREAIEIYEQVLALAPGDDTELRRTARHEIAALRFQLGNYKGVVEVLGPLLGGKHLGATANVASILLQTARAHLRIGNFQDAEILLEEATKLDELRGSTCVGVLLARAELHFYRGNPVESLRLCSRLLQEGDSQLDGASLIELYMLMADNHSFLENRETAASFCQLALRLIQPEGGKQLLALSLFCRGNYYWYKGLFSLAIKQFRLAMVLFRELDALDRQADCLLKIGSLCHLLGRPQEARSPLRQAAATFEEIGNRSRSVETLTLLGDVHAVLGESELCHKMLEASHRDSHDLSNPRLPVKILLSRAGVALDRGDLETASQHLVETREGDRPVALISGEMVQALALESQLEYYRGNLGTAMERAVKGLRVAREIDDSLGAAKLQTQLALLLTITGNASEARKELVTLLDVATRSELVVSEGWVRLLEAKLLTQEDKHEKAKKSLVLSAEHLMAEGSERDLVQLYLEHGMLSLRMADHEQAYLDLEEGLYLAKKLALHHAQCRYHLMIGLFEATIESRNAARAGKAYLTARNLAAQAPYPELLWQADYRLGKLVLAKDRKEAQKYLSAAMNTLHEVISELPNHVRRSYLKVGAARELLELAGVRQAV